MENYNYNEEIIDESDLIIDETKLEQPEEPKEELSSIEINRQKSLLREDNYKKRFEALHNAKQTCQQLGLPPVDIYFNQHILYNKDSNTGNRNMLQLEEKDKQLYKFKLIHEWSEKRKNKYKLLDNSLMEALAEKEAGDDKKMKEYLKKRKQIQLDHPKVTMD